MKKITKLFLTLILVCTSLTTLNTKLETKVHAAPSDDFVYTVRGLQATIMIANKSIPYTATYTDSLGTHTATSSGNNSISITFAGSGALDIHEIRLSGIRRLGNQSTETGIPGVVDVKQWGTAHWTDLENAFVRARTLESITATDVPDLTGVTSLKSMFFDTPKFTSGNIDGWDVSHVTDMYRMFRLSAFNSPINHWDVSHVLNMMEMFEDSRFNQSIDDWDVGNVEWMYGMFESSQYNQPLNSWNVSKVQTMNSMFRYSKYNQPLNNWNTSSVTDMTQMFESSVFNQPIDNWNVSNVSNMRQMFQSSVFNQPIDNWNVANVQNMFQMFFANAYFNQSLEHWDVGKVTDMTGMFFANTLTSHRAPLSPENYNKILKGWSSLAVAPSRVLSVNTAYSDAASRAALLAKGWVINGDWLAQNKIKITKIDSANSCPLAGATFEIFDTSTPPVSKGTVTTDGNGEAITNGLPLGNYTVVETVAPLGYELDATPQPVTLSNLDETVPLTFGGVFSVGKIKLVATDSADSTKKLAGANLQLQTATGDYIDWITTDGTGEFITRNLHLGNYKIAKINSPSGYEPDASTIPVSLTVHGATVTVPLTYDQSLAKIKLTLTDSADSTKKLAGAQYSIRNSSNFPMGTIQTDSNGEAISSNLPLGNYNIVQTVAPVGYELDSSTFNVWLSTHGATVPVSRQNILSTASIAIEKVDSKNSGIRLGGAEFSIRDASNNEVQKLTSSLWGQVTSNILPLGNYTVVETKAPVGYELDSTPTPVSLTTHGSIVPLTITDVQSVGKIFFTLADSLDSTKKLAGAQYSIRNISGGESATIVTDSNGEVTSTDLPLGNYTLVETVPPVGYGLDTTPIPVSLTTHGATVSASTTNVYLIAKIKLTKVDSVDSTKKLAGAEFSIRNASNFPVGTLQTDSNGEATSTDLPLGMYKLVETTAPVGYELDATPVPVTLATHGATELVTKSNVLSTSKIQLVNVDAKTQSTLAGGEFSVRDGSNNEVATFQTNHLGEATSVLIPLGNYTLVQTKAPARYEIAAPISVSLTTHGSVVPVTVKNILSVGKVKITKTDSVDTTKKLTGAEFSIRDVANDEVGRLVTDSNGEATSNNLPLGDYTLVETKAPAGYELDLMPTPVTLSTHGAIVSITKSNTFLVAKIKLTKIDSINVTKKLAGAEFSIRNASNFPVGTLQTDSNGEATSTDLPLGVYRLVETTAPTGYEIDPTPILVTLSTHGTIVPVTKSNVMSTGKIAVTKLDSVNSSRRLQGAEFSVRDASNNEVTTLKTNALGEGVTNVLPLGNYTLVETKAPTGYELDTTPIPATITTHGEIVPVVVGNVLSAGKIKVTKTDSVDATKKLAGAEISIRDMSNIEVGILRTDNNGEATSSDLPLGNYTLVETKVPAGYEVDSTPTPVTLTTHGVTVNVTKTNVFLVAKIKLTKVDNADATKKLAGAEFSIQNSSNIQVGTLQTDSNGEATSNDLPIGAYRLVETQAPTGYELDATPIPVTLSTHGTVVPVTKSNVMSTGKIAVTKLDSANSSRRLQGAEFSVRDASNNEITTLKTNVLGEGVTNLLPLGNYTLVETKAPNGYTLDATPIPVTLTTHGVIVPVVVGNVLSVGKVKLTTIDSADTTRKLAGAKFSIRDAANAEVGTLLTDNNGEATSSDLLLGNYTLVEIQAPAGYGLDATPVPVTLSTHGVTVPVTVGNVFSIGKIKLTNIDSVDATKKLAGAEYSILDTANVEVGTLQTDNNGEAVSNNLPVGAYSLVETKAPVGYQIDATPIPVTLTTHNVTVPVTKKSVLSTAKIKVVKTDSQDPTRKLAGAEFSIRKVSHSRSNNEVGTMQTDYNGEALSQDLPLGSYVVVETKAPRGYEIDATPIPVELIAHGSTVLAVKGEVLSVGRIKITETDSTDTTKKLAGVLYSIRNADNDQVGTMQTDTNGEALSNRLPLGNYTLVRVKAADGYNLDATPMPVSLTVHGVSQAVTQGSTLSTGKVVVSKIDKETQGRVSGMVFKVKNLDTDVDKTIDMKEKNVIEVTDLPLGTYEITEVTAPNGYEIDTTAHTVVIKRNGDVKKLDMYGVKKAETAGVGASGGISSNGGSSGEYNSGSYSFTLPQTGVEKAPQTASGNFYTVFASVIFVLMLCLGAFAKRNKKLSKQDQSVYSMSTQVKTVSNANYTNTTEITNNEVQTAQQTVKTKEFKRLFTTKEFIESYQNTIKSQRVLSYQNIRKYSWVRSRDKVFKIRKSIGKVANGNMKLFSFRRC